MDPGAAFAPLQVRSFRRFFLAQAVNTAGSTMAPVALAFAGLEVSDSAALGILLGTDPDLLPLLAAAFLAGAGMEVFGLGWNLAMQENIEERMLSRAYSYDMLGSYVAIPVGQRVYGPLGAAFGYRDVLVVSGIAYLAIALLTLLSPDVRNLRRTT
jgi:hypothetical protein